jgi:outer membrane protein assembly factor BamB
LRIFRGAVLSLVVCWTGCSSPLDLVFSVSGDAPSRTGLVPLGDGGLFGNEAGRVVQLGAGGAPQWTAELAHEVRVTPAVVGDTVVVATVDGDVVGLDAATGTRRWRTALPRATALAGLGTHAHLLTEDGELLVLEASDGVVLRRTTWNAALGMRPGSPARLGLVATPQGRLVLAGPAALIAVGEDGSRRWRTVVREPGGLLVDGAVVWTVDQTGRAVGLALETGELRWQRALGTGPTSPPARALDRIWVGLQNRSLVGFRPGDDGPPWTVEVPAPVVAAVVEFQGRLLVPTSGREGRLLALDVGAPGNPPSARVDSPLRTAPLVRGELAWLLAQDGRVLGFRLRSAAGSAR